MLKVLDLIKKGFQIKFLCLGIWSNFGVCVCKAEKFSALPCHININVLGIKWGVAFRFLLSNELIHQYFYVEKDTEKLLT